MDCFNEIQDTLSTCSVQPVEIHKYKIIRMLVDKHVANYITLPIIFCHDSLIILFILLLQLPTLSAKLQKYSSLTVYLLNLNKASF